MRRAGALLALALGIAPGAAALAVEADFLDGAWSSEAGCRWLATEESRRDPDVVPTILTRQGFSEIEWTCRFVDLLEDQSGQSWVGVLFCEEPGFSYPDLVAIRRLDEARLQVQFRDAASSERDPEFVKCPEGAE